MFQIAFSSGGGKRLQKQQRESSEESINNKETYVEILTKIGLIYEVREKLSSEKPWIIRSIPNELVHLAKQISRQDIKTVNRLLIGSYDKVS
jgi:hypothetical protein